MTKRDGWRLRPLTKYLLIQIPGWALVAAALWLVRQWIDLPLWAAVGVFLLWVIKDLILFPFLRPAFESGGKGGLDRLIGAEGIAAEHLDPSGYVRVGGELWRAEALETGEPIPRGSRVRVEDARGMTLFVRPAK
jgi:membrane-bound serine protease (ClpP class)